jgi:hypothetical protein
VAEHADVDEVFGRRRMRIGAALASMAVVAIVVAAFLLRGDSPGPQPSASKPTPTQATITPSPDVTPTQGATAADPGELGRLLLLRAADVGPGWTLDPNPRPAVELRFDPCGDGELGPKADGGDGVRRLTSPEGEVVQHAMLFSDPEDATAAMQALRDAVDRCGSGGKVSYDERGPLAGVGDSVVLQQRASREDPTTTFVTAFRIGHLVMTVADFRIGGTYSEQAHRALVAKARALLPER